MMSNGLSLLITIGAMLLRLFAEVCRNVCFSKPLCLLVEAWHPAPSGSASPTSRLTSPDEIFAPFLIGLFSIGLCVLAVWVIRRLFRPRKFGLASTPGRRNEVNPLHLLMLLALWLGATAACYAPLIKLKWLDAAQSEVLATVVGQVVWVAGCLLVAGLTFRGGMVRGMGLSRRHWVYDSGRAVVAYFSVIPICLTLLYFATRAFQGVYHVDPPAHAMLQAMAKLSGAWKLLVVFSAVVMASLVEEIFCRGLVQSMFRRYTGRPWLAIMLASIVFVLLHYTSADVGATKVVNWQPMPALFALSVVLGYNYERSGRLLAPILIHAIFNATFVGMFLVGK